MTLRVCECNENDLRCSERWKQQGQEQTGRPTRSLVLGEHCAQWTARPARPALRCNQIPHREYTPLARRSGFVESSVGMQIVSPGPSYHYAHGVGRIGARLDEVSTIDLSFECRLACRQALMNSASRPSLLGMISRRYLPLFS